jgi:hypothetical protein
VYLSVLSKRNRFSQRVQLCESGVEAQRALFLAFLAKHSKITSWTFARQKLPGRLQKPLLRRAKPRLSSQTAKRGHLPASFGLS